MSNQQQPSRPRPSWFRVAQTPPATLVNRPPAPPLPSVSGINVTSYLPSSARPAFPPPTSSLPSSPVVKPPHPKLVGSTSPVLSSPVSKSHLVVTSSLPSSTKTGSAALKNDSPPSPKSPLQLIETKPTAQPPPPSQVKPKFSSEADQETLVVRKTEEEDNKSYNPSNVTTITLAGDNRGAAMGVFRSPGSGEEGEGKKSKGERRRGGWGRRGKDGVIVNSNVQGINNSIIFDSSCNYYDPGVHLTLP
ncbi:hypothetical protein LINGRAHAP2_LOCUS14956 [Linum grandiflorum]